MSEGKLLWLLTLTIFFHSRSLHGNSEGRLASPSNSCFVDDAEECDATIHGFNGSIVGFPGSLFRPLPSRGVFNVEDYGAKGDGTDDSQAFGEAWRAACNSSSSAVLLVPENNKYILKPVAFSGPCRAHMTVMIKGTLEASSNRSDWNVDNIRHWILFDGIRNLVVRGGGTVDGNGHVWWQHSCKRNTSLPCIDAPTALFFSSCKNLVVEDLVVKDSQQMHVAFRRCTNVKASKLTISAPESSPNTDGIHVSGTKSILIKDTIIETGDDCISIVSGSRRVIATRIVCGPGHGISIGSLGANNTRAHVSKVLVDKVILKGTTNGVRIKTWQLNIHDQ
nr:PREDICTED: polygalacturonase-like isoform X2 [Musa acuminata subsp. malaccensis]